MPQPAYERPTVTEVFADEAAERVWQMLSQRVEETCARHPMYRAAMAILEADYYDTRTE